MYALYWLLLTPIVSAQADNLSVSGFGTLGIISSDSSQYGYRTELSQGDGSFNNKIDYKSSTVLGLQLDYTFNDNTNVVLQNIYNDQHINLNTTTRLAFVNYTPTPDLSVRLGRMAVDLFLFTQFRDVNFGYTWAHTPTEVYGLVPFRHIDGLDITYQSKLFGISLISSVYAGNSRAHISSYNFETHIEIEDVYGLSFNLNAYNWSLQWRYSNAILNADDASYNELNEGLAAISQIPGFNSIWPKYEEALIGLKDHRSRIDYISVAGRYNQNHWSYVAEASSIQPHQDLISDTLAGYASVIYHQDNMNYFGSYSIVRSDGIRIDSQDVNLAALASIPGGTELYKGVKTAINFYSSNQSTVSLGWRWDISSQLALKFQWDHTNVNDRGGALWLNKDISTTPKATINTFSSNVSYIF
jgi:hypothetical protein